VQDELSLAADRLKLTAALRFDNASFYDGAFVIDNPTGETTFMYDLVDPALDKVNWTALSPKLSVLYLLSGNARVYFSWARGFRQPVLDELCRYGRIRGGFKLANPSLGPETIDNFEIGADIQVGNKLNASLSAYQSYGRSFMYYVNTGDSIDMGFGLRPILSRQNISGVSVTGVETELTYLPFERMSITAAYAFNRSTITAFKVDSYSPADITGNFLTDVPAHLGSLRLTWLVDAGSVSLVSRYTGSSWVNDLNTFDEVVGSDRYPSWFSTDVKGTCRLRSVTISLGVQNIFNQSWYDSKGAVCPGRFITFETGVKF
jgi:iron complex outermembrane receptor protein